jgi:hypothetical protein
MHGARLTANHPELAPEDDLRRVSFTHASALETHVGVLGDFIATRECAARTRKCTQSHDRHAVKTDKTRGLFVATLVGVPRVCWVLGRVQEGDLGWVGLVATAAMPPIKSAGKNGGAVVDIDDLVDRAFDAMCTAMDGDVKDEGEGESEGESEGDSEDDTSSRDGGHGEEFVAVTPAPVAVAGPRTTLDYGASRVGSYLSGSSVDASGAPVATQGLDDSDAVAFAAGALSEMERTRGSLAPVSQSARARKAAGKRARAANDTTGAKWFNMPAGAVTPETETTLKLMRLRKCVALSSPRFAHAIDTRVNIALVSACCIQL